MSKFLNATKSGAKMLGTASVQMLLGGLVAAVIPPNVSVAYKAAAAIGGCVVAMCANDPIDRAVEKQFADIEAAVEETKRNIEILKQTEINEEVTE